MFYVLNVSDCRWCISNMILVTDYEKKQHTSKWIYFKGGFLENFGHTFNEDKLAMVSNLRIYVFLCFAC